MTEAEYKKETAWYKRFMSAKSINPQPKAVRERLHMVTSIDGQASDTKPFYVGYASSGCLYSAGAFHECYGSLANYWVERLKKS